MLQRTIFACLAALHVSAASAQPLDCLIAPKQIADVAFGVNGVVSRLLVERGDRVRQGDVLAYLDDSMEAANLAIARARNAETAAIGMARAQLAASESKFKRNETLRNRQILATSKFEEVEVELETNRLKVLEQEEANRLKSLDVKRAEAALALRRIVSPFDGVVVERHVSPGEYLENKRALTLAQIDPVYADVIAPSSMFAGFKKGQKIKVVVMQPTEMEVVAETAVVDPYVDAASGTLRVRLAIANPDYRVIPGFRCRADVETGDTDRGAQALPGAGSPKTR